MVIDLVEAKLSFAELKLSNADSDQTIFSVDCRPAVSAFKGAIMLLQPLSTLANALKAPMNDLSDFTVLGGSHWARGDTWCADTESVP